MLKSVALVLIFTIICTASVIATVFGTVRILVHDPQHRPVQGASVSLKSSSSDWSETSVTNGEGTTEFITVPLGKYEATVAASGFTPTTAPVSAISGRLVEIHIQLRLMTVQEQITVSAAAAENTSSSTPQSTVDRSEIARTPGADRTNSLSFITNFVPGAYVVHDQLHVRGGHQVTWALDGVSLPNTNIASNVGPQFDPKDADYVEEQRGTYSAEYGDRTYGVFNVIPRSGFERNKQADLLLSYGSYNSTDDQLSVGDHSERSAYYVSLSGNRSDYGLETPTAARLNDQAWGGSIFSSLQTNLDSQNQLRFVGSFRHDDYHVPNDPDSQAAGVRDDQNETDSFGIFTYAHTFDTRTLLTISPFFHFNRAKFEGGPEDIPIATDDRKSAYEGGQFVFSMNRGHHNLSAGLYTFAQQDDHFFSVTANDGSGNALSQRIKPDGNLEALFLEDQYQPRDWLTFNLGARFTRFSGGITETRADPRLGIAVMIPDLRWVVRGAYSRFYQAPPLATVSGPLLQFAVDQGFGFLPLKGERDEQYDFGVTVPIEKWSVDADYFRTNATNFFDHDVLENSNIFFPLTIEHARIRGFELALRSPETSSNLRAHLTYSHQIVEGSGGVTGGLTDFEPPESGLFPLDHDQRNTLSAGLSENLPGKSWAAINVNYGSGFLNGDGPDHLPAYYTLDVAFGKSFGENIALKISATNLTNQRYFIDLSNTFGGSHFSDPRQISVQLRYGFHY